jgi:hypothetical protein
MASLGNFVESTSFGHPTVEGTCYFKQWFKGTYSIYYYLSVDPLPVGATLPPHFMVFEGSFCEECVCESWLSPNCSAEQNSPPRNPERVKKAELRSLGRGPIIGSPYQNYKMTGRFCEEFVRTGESCYPGFGDYEDCPYCGKCVPLTIMSEDIPGSGVGSLSFNQAMTTLENEFSKYLDSLDYVPLCECIGAGVMIV